MKTIQFLLFFLALSFNVFAQNTDPLSYHTSHQISDSSYSLKKANGDSTIFLFEGSSSSNSGYRTMSVNADSTQVIWEGGSQPADTLEIWGSKITSDSAAVNTTTWGLNGNSISDSNFIGSTNNGPLIFKVNKVVSGKIDPSSSNLSFGKYSFGQNTFGDYNTAYGSNTLQYNILGRYNTAIGDSSLFSNTSGDFNIGLGYKAGGNNTTTSQTLYISDSTIHMYMRLDSLGSITPNVAGVDANGYWHIYPAPVGTASTAANGITKSGTKFIWGGTLENPTVIDGTFNHYNVSYINSGTLSFLSDTVKLNTLRESLIRINNYRTSDNALEDGVLVQFGSDTVYQNHEYSDGINGSDGRIIGSGMYILRDGIHLIVERRSTFDSLPLHITAAYTGYVPCYFEIVPSDGYKMGCDSIFLLDHYLGTRTYLSKTDTTIYNYDQPNAGAIGDRFTITFSGSGNNYVGASKIIANPDSTGGTPTNIVYFDKDTMKIGPYPQMSVNDRWSLTGNAGTTSSNFIGTTDNVELMFRVNNVLAGRTGKGQFSNTSFGAQSQPIGGTGLYNASFGSLASANLRSGGKNTDIGYEAGLNNLTGNFNTRVGEGANIWDTSSSYNAVLGTEALNHTSLARIPGGGYNTALGSFALNKHAAYRGNIGLGFWAGNGLTGNNTLFVSDSAYHMYFKLDSAVGTAPNVVGKDANGYWHVYSKPTGSGESSQLPYNGISTDYLGGDTLYHALPNSWNLGGNSDATASSFIGPAGDYPLVFKSNGMSIGFAGGSGSSVAFGKYTYSYDTASKYTWSYNVAIGERALYSLKSAGWNINMGNVAIGPSALTSATEGHDNVAIGSLALAAAGGTQNNTFVGNVAIGPTSLTSLHSGIHNIAIGDSSFRNLTTGNYNIGLGGKVAWNQSTLSSLAGYANNVLCISDSTYHIHMKLDSATGSAPNVLGKDGSGNWHVYELPGSSTSGTATLVSGTVTVSTTLVKTGAKIYVSVNTPSGTQGFLSAPMSNIIDGTSFVINSTSGTENSTVNWQIINP